MDSWARVFASTSLNQPLLLLPTSLYDRLLEDHLKRFLACLEEIASQNGWTNYEVQRRANHHLVLFQWHTLITRHVKTQRKWCNHLLDEIQRRVVAESRQRSGNSEALAGILSEALTNSFLAPARSGIYYCPIIHP
jgi:hypothetical protein